MKLVPPERPAPARRWRALLSAIILLFTPVYGLAYDLYISPNNDRSDASFLGSSDVSGEVYIFVSPEAGLKQVRFYLNANAVKTENVAPWDFAGTAPDDAAYAFDSRTIINGDHVARADLFLTDGTSESISAGFRVANEGSQVTPPLQFHMGWREDPARTLIPAWFLALPPSDPHAQYRLAGTSTWLKAPASVRYGNGDGGLLEAPITGLLPASDYELRVVLDDGSYSEVYRTRTAPGEGAQDFQVLFVADTGLVGREDGLATGTEQVIDELAAEDAAFVLLGGDYAYFDTDKRYGTLERTIAAWFDQMAPVMERFPVMPTYGNHEVLLGEDYSTWAAQFPTPEGWNQRRMYSFDVGDAHFLSVFGLDERYELPADALTWLDHDLQSARDRGQRWLIPFMHAAPFSEGTNHPSALKLRQQLGPLYEKHGVQVALTTHDQSFERTYPLRGVPATNTPTSNSLSCYTLDDGVTWIKVSPGGKLSNISKGFSPWRSEQPPIWTATRDNTRHHIARLSFSAAGTLTVDTLGIMGDGSAPQLQDRFQYTTAGCGPELTIAPEKLTFALEADERETQMVQVDSTGDALEVTVDSLPSWLEVTPQTGVTPLTLDVTADAAGLAAGLYEAQVGVTDQNGASVRVPVSAQVGAGDYALWISGLPDRSLASPLEASVLQGNRYIFLAPEQGATRVEFHLDDTSASGTPDKVENLPPFDLGGTAPNDTAYAYDTERLPDGSHTLTARVSLEGGGSQLTTSSFRVDNAIPAWVVDPADIALSLDAAMPVAEALVSVGISDGGPWVFTADTNATWLMATPDAGETPETIRLDIDASALSPGHYQGLVRLSTLDVPDATITVNLAYDLSSSYELQVSLDATRSPSQPLAGQTLSGLVYISVPEVPGIQKVEFYLDDEDRSGSPFKVEGNAPWDFNGTQFNDPARRAIAFDTSGLMSGSHVITALVHMETESLVVNAGFVVE